MKSTNVLKKKVMFKSRRRLCAAFKNVSICSTLIPLQCIFLGGSNATVLSFVLLHMLNTEAQQTERYWASTNKQIANAD